MEMPASIAKLMPLMAETAAGHTKEHLETTIKRLQKRWAWLDSWECAIYYACVTELRARKHMGRKRKAVVAV